MPMFFSRGDEYDVTRHNVYFFFICGNNTFTLGDNKHLFATMAVELISDTLVEINLSDNESITPVWS